jgi:hypothetical protein
MAQGQPTKVKKKKKSVLKRAAQARQHVHAHASAASTPTGMKYRSHMSILAISGELDACAYGIGVVMNARSRPTKNITTEFNSW